jgi:hypothetical protein
MIDAISRPWLSRPDLFIVAPVANNFPLSTIAGFVGRLWAISHTDDTAARIVVVYTSFYTLAAPLLFHEYARR